MNTLSILPHHIVATGLHSLFEKHPHGLVNLAGSVTKGLSIYRVNVEIVPLLSVTCARDIQILVFIGVKNDANIARLSLTDIGLESRDELVVSAGGIDGDGDGREGHE
jgi:hypothetical protein